MAGAKRFSVLVASDESSAARAAVRTALRCPWPVDVHVHGVVASDIGGDTRRSIVLSALDGTAEAAARATARALHRRWPNASVTVVNGPAVDAIVSEARRLRSRVIVLGWRGHGPIKRMVVGSVSRGVLRRAPCAVLVVRLAPRQVKQVVIGVDNSAHARHAVRLVAQMTPPVGGRAIVVTAVDMMRVPTQIHLDAATRARVSAEVGTINRRRLLNAQALVGRAAEVLKGTGWTVATDVTRGAPVWDLLKTVEKFGADLLVVGARGATGLDRLLLGSTAEGVLNRSRVPVLVVP